MATTTLCSTSFLSAVNSLPETPAVYRSSRVKPIAVLSGYSRRKVRGKRRETVAKSCGAVGYSRGVEAGKGRRGGPKFAHFQTRVGPTIKTGKLATREPKVH